MKKDGKIIMTIATICLVLNIIFLVIGLYKYEKNIGSYWNLSRKSSTIEEKSYYIDLYIAKLESCNMQGKHNAIFFKTPDNSYDYNIKALKSLQKRLIEIKEMDITSFEYQTAIQQITAQEEGEADAMIRTLQSIWWKSNYILLWGWISVIQVLICIFLFVVGWILINK